MDDPGCITIHFRDIGTGVLQQGDFVNSGFGDDWQLGIPRDSENEDHLWWISRGAV